MKKLILCLSLAAGFMLTSCLEKPAEKEVIYVPTPAPVQAPARVIIEKQTVIEKEKPVVETEKPAGTRISVDENGFKVGSKDVDIELKK